jgi:predicted metal-dependent peptidase
MSQEIIKDIRRVLSSLAVVAPFSYPMLMMPIELRSDLRSWAGTNGVTLFINPNKWPELKFKEKMFVAMHEWIHIVMQHAKRMQGRRRRIWNTSCDFITNDMILFDLGDHFLPPSGILFDQIYRNKTAEQVYNLLLEAIDYKKEQEETPKCNHCDQEYTKQDRVAQDGENSCGGCGRPSEQNIPAPQFTDAEDAVSQLMTDDYGAPWGNDLFQSPSSVDDQQMIDAIIKAAARAKAMKRGRLPGRYEEYVETLKRTDIPWERILYRYAKKSLKGNVDRNPYKPDPKYLPFDVIVPTEEVRKLAKLVFIVDTSRSMEKEDFEYACGQLQRLGTMVDKCTVITADTQVQEVIRVKKIVKELKDRKIKFKGRGGTDMNEAFKVAEKLNPDLIVLYSDMVIADNKVSWPPKPRRAQTIFLATQNSPIDEAPYGIFIKMKKRLS